MLSSGGEGNTASSENTRNMAKMTDAIKEILLLNSIHLVQCISGSLWVHSSACVLKRHTALSLTVTWDQIVDLQNKDDHVLDLVIRFRHGLWAKFAWNVVDDSIGGRYKPLPVVQNKDRRILLSPQFNTIYRKKFMIKSVTVLEIFSYSQKYIITRVHTAVETKNSRAFQGLSKTVIMTFWSTQIDGMQYTECAGM